MEKMLTDKKIIFKSLCGIQNSSNSNPIAVPDWLATESILTITVNNNQLTSFSCSPENLEEMAVGFLFSGGIISKLSDIKSIRLCIENVKVDFILNDDCPFDNKVWQKHQTITSGCGQGKSLRHELLKSSLHSINGSVQLKAEYICELFNDLRNISQGYKNTGCIHLAALIKEGGPSVIREDIGRHNAIDKVIGAGLRLGLDFSKYILCCSGRISSDMLLKAAKASIPVVASRAAPTSLAVEIASELNITLLGFVRGQKFNIYSAPERILYENNFCNIDRISETVENIVTN
jgi:FdhD protein